MSKVNIMLKMDLYNKVYYAPICLKKSNKLTIAIIKVEYHNYINCTLTSFNINGIIVINSIYFL